MHVEHTLQTEPKVAKFRPWVQEIVIVVVERPADATGMLVGIIGGLLLLIVVIVVCVRRPVVIVVPKSTTRAAFHSLKIL